MIILCLVKALFLKLRLDSLERALQLVQLFYLFLSQQLCFIHLKLRGISPVILEMDFLNMGPYLLLARRNPTDLLFLNSTLMSLVHKTIRRKKTMFASKSVTREGE